ncbi:MAG: hypothetical protein M3Y41_13205 [Pseudomonadota bacterium]|nr:hypothetical protein [Pseudomonadota bacterium]
MTATQAPPPPAAATLDPAGTAVHILTPMLGVIRGTVEMVPATAQVAFFAFFWIEPDGSLGYEHSGGSEVFWDGMTTKLREHPATGRPGIIFDDRSGSEFHADDLLRCLPNARIAGCPHCAALAPPEAVP